MSPEPGNQPPPPPGAPAALPTSLEEPTDPQPPRPPKSEQQSPDTVSPTGADLDAEPTTMSQQGAYLTTSVGVRLRDTDHSLRAGPRGPTLLQDHHLREKITHFDHERIPERVVHARGAGAHGVFVGYGNAGDLTRAAFLGEGVETPVFVRFSTVIGSRGSADTVRDTRGFAAKFYTAEGTFDLVGNNMPVFFVQDGIKFPDVIHAAKPHPDREIPQAQTAHDTFWDFVSLHTEAQHHTIWAMSDRAIPRSYRHMEGFGVHTFRLVNVAGDTSLVKFHWKPRLGVHSLTWEEAQLLGGTDPDFHRRDLYDAIEAGAHPQWELGIQVFPDTPEQTFEGIDLLDPTKLVPEELAPVQPIGLLTLSGTPTNFFAESEQVAFHVGNLVPGIDVTDDPLLQVRLFSYIDTQLTRLGGPNYNQLPINRPHTDVNDMLRDGMHQSAVHAGVAPYRPNSLDGGCPFVAGDSEGAFLDVPQAVVAGSKVRELSASFDDHFSQARLFWLSMSPVEQDHIVQAYTFELGKCYDQTDPRTPAALPGADRRRPGVGRRRGPRDAGPGACGRRAGPDPQPGALAARAVLAGRGPHGRHRRGPHERRCGRLGAGRRAEQRWAGPPPRGTHGRSGLAGSPRGRAPHPAHRPLRRVRRDRRRRGAPTRATRRAGAGRQGRRRGGSRCGPEADPARRRGVPPRQGHRHPRWCRGCRRARSGAGCRGHRGRGCRNGRGRRRRGSRDAPGLGPVHPGPLTRAPGPTRRPLPAWRGGAFSRR